MDREELIEIIEEVTREINHNINDIRETIEEISTRLYSIEKDIEEIKDSDTPDNLKDFDVIFNKRFAEVNAGIKTILNKIGQ